MNQLVHETKTLAISTVLLPGIVNIMDSISGTNPSRQPYETMVFNLVDGEPEFDSPIETKRYSTRAEAEQGHAEMVQKYDPK